MMQLQWSILLLLWWGESAVTQAPTSEHKIHNIVLYPDKHSWCKTTEIKQIVTFPRCSSVEIDNNVCVGACFSYSIPQSSPAAPGEVITPYCDSCQPHHYTWKEVKLTCESLDDEEEDGTVDMTKRVQVITNCTCAPCQKNFVQNDSHKPAESSSVDVPELMSLMMHQKNHQKEEISEEDDLDESAGISSHPEKTELDNLIDVDEVKSGDHAKEVDTVEVVHVNKQPAQHGTFHVEVGPHHSLILKPDKLPEHHPAEHTHHHKHAERDDEEEVPSLLKNQFKEHEDHEFPDQLAVESRKEFAEHDGEVLSVPELIFKEHALLEGSKHEDTELHHVKHHHRDESKDSGVAHNPGMKIVEVPHHQLTPAVEGGHVTYQVKHEHPAQKE